MIDRLRSILKGDITATSVDLNYYTHEIREWVRYRNMGWADGVPANAQEATDLWRQCHTATLEDYKLPLQRDDLLYHADALPFLFD